MPDGCKIGAARNDAPPVRDPFSPLSWSDLIGPSGCLMHKADKDSPVKPEDGSNGAGGRQWKGSWWFTAGYRCVSPMGRSLSEAQTELLKAGGERELILLFDGDDPARDTIKKVGCDLLAEGFGVVAPVVTEDFKPHRADEKLLRELLSG